MIMSRADNKTEGDAAELPPHCRLLLLLLPQDSKSRCLYMPLR